jgi:hypothetical protein
MTERPTAGSPLEIDRVDLQRGEAGSIQLRLRGRWLDPAAATEEELLVVQVEGRRHRFPGARAEPGGEADHDPSLAGETPGPPWGATFTVPDWAEPRHEGQAALWLGSAVVPVPPPGWSPPVAAPPAAAPPSPGPEPVPVPVPVPEKVATLQAELEQRTGETVRLRGALSHAQSELEARRASGAALESTQEQLRQELARLTAAVDRNRRDAEAATERQRTENARLREELAAVQVARDAALGEVGGLRAELERIGTELAATRERVSAESGDLGEANRLLADARALADQLRGT